jgi:hypothetical protein
MTMVALLLSSCAVQIQDAQFCSPLPNGLGAACDNFLTSQPLTMDESQWISQQALWAEQGLALECTTSKSLGDFKGEIEKLCSKVKCTYAEQVAIKKFFAKVKNDEKAVQSSVEF